MGMEYDAVRYRLVIVGDKEPNAMADGDDTIYLTAGLFKYSDETIAFIIAHELSHVKLGHVAKVRAVSYATTGVMTVVGYLVPGAGYLNHVVNPAVTNNYSKLQEYDADKLAWDTCKRCLGFGDTVQRQILESIKNDASGGGGFWSTHPAWEDRIKNIRETQ
jgi:Zn-dependent protease with chaperone function